MPWTIPVVMLLVVAALRGGGGTLADAAFFESLRRAIVAPAQRSMTMADVPAGDVRAAQIEPPVAEPEVTTPPGELPPSVAAAPVVPAEPAMAESEWRDKMAAARQALERDQVLADGMQSRVNALTTDSIARDDPAQRAELLKQRTRAIIELDHLTLQVEKDKLAIAAIEEDARKKGIPPGWIRSINELTN
jgi:hypothetical protein